MNFSGTDVSTEPAPCSVLLQRMSQSQLCYPKTLDAQMRVRVDARVLGGVQCVLMYSDILSESNITLCSRLNVFLSQSAKPIETPRRVQDLSSLRECQVDTKRSTRKKKNFKGLNGVLWYNC